VVFCLILGLVPDASANQLDESAPAQIDDGHIVGAFAADESQFSVWAEGDVRRRAADFQARARFVFIRVYQANARFARIGNDKRLSIRAEREKVWIDTHRNLRGNATISAFPNR
jgi:hypothetical protein